MTILLEERRAAGVAWLTLNRPERRNALDPELIRALHEAVLRLGAEPSCRVLALAAAGTAFCAGADLHAMRALGRVDAAANREDAAALAKLLLALHECPKPTLALVQGAAFGGGVGVTAVCDVALAGAEAKFRLPEVQLGIVPAVISPYVVAAIGPRQASRYFLSGESLDAIRAAELGLVHEVVPTAELERRGLELAAQIALGGPEALAAAKTLLRDVAGRRPGAQLVAETADLLARLRAGSEAQEGLSAALEKRAPAWRTP